MSKGIKYKTIIKCPICKYKKEVTMPEDSCVILYDCEECEARLKPTLKGCCIFCSYGSVPCPEAQKEIMLKQQSASNK